jgi:hypothetical protein
MMKAAGTLRMKEASEAAGMEEFPQDRRTSL